MGVNHLVRLRCLKEKDAIYMLECLHEIENKGLFKKDMLAVQLEDAVRFCISAQKAKLADGMDIHFAIVEEEDEYLGTISLKNINTSDKTAEYAIIARKKARGKGIAAEATMLLLDKAFHEYNLHKVYLNVISNNESAIRLYERCGFVHEGTDREGVLINNNYETLEWYGMIDREFARGG